MHGGAKASRSGQMSPAGAHCSGATTNRTSPPISGSAIYASLKRVKHKRRLPASTASTDFATTTTGSAADDCYRGRLTKYLAQEALISRSLCAGRTKIGLAHGTAG